MNETHPDAITLRRCTERTLWMLYLADVSSGIHVRPRQLLDYQMSNIALPTNEAEFSWHGGCRPPLEARELAFGVDALNLPGAVIHNADISEFGHLIRSVSFAASVQRSRNLIKSFTSQGVNSVQDYGSVRSSEPRPSTNLETCRCLGG
jgi:hypothetical protein